MKNLEIRNAWNFSSNRVDAEMGINFFGRRYYSLSMARCLTSDPVGFAGSIESPSACNNPWHQDGRDDQIPLVFSVPVILQAAAVTAVAIGVDCGGNAVLECVGVGQLWTKVVEGVSDDTDRGCDWGKC